MKSITLKEYFKIIKPTYVYLKLTPTNSIRNYNSDKIAKAINSIYKDFTQRIIKYERQIQFHCPSKVSYYVYIEKHKTEFYFIVPEVYLHLLKEKIGDTWKGITVKQVEAIPVFDKTCKKYALQYSKEDGLSLATDKRTNTLLSSTLNVINVMEEEDRIGVFYNFMPLSQYAWRADHEKTLKKIKDNYPVDKEKNLTAIMKYCAAVIIEIANMLIEVFTELSGHSKDKTQDVRELLFSQYNQKQLSDSTIRKKDETILGTQIVVLSDSKDRLRKHNNAVAVSEAFKSIGEDNQLVYHSNSKDIDFNRYSLNVEVNKMSAKEIQNLIALPGRELLEEYKTIEKIDTFESEVAKELQTGTICIGENTYRGSTQKAYLSEDKEYKYLTLTIIGPTRAGKTTLISNISNDSIKNGECTIIFDFCGNCDLSEDVSKAVDKVLNIDCSDFDNLQGLGYNEVTPSSNNIFEVYRCAKTKTSQLMTLVNSINNDDSELRARMERFLEAAAVIVFISDGPIRDVFNVLQNYKLRHEYIEQIPEEQIQNLEEYIYTLQELDDKDGGTKMSISSGILNRVNKLKQNTYMELMLKKDCRNNFNLVKEMQKSQLICIRMPENMFSTEQEKDIYCTYWFTKIWGALQKRKWNYPDVKKRTKVNILIDELYQVPNCQDFLRSKLSQIAKFGCKVIISCHYLGQIGIIRNELKAANSSYMLLAGCDKDNYKELKDELLPYTVEDLLNLKRYHSLNYVKVKDGYSKFITKLPKPI